jgi:hypothetical protein
MKKTAIVLTFVCVTILIVSGIVLSNNEEEVVTNETYIEFPLTLPGEKIQVKKTYDNGELGITSNSEHIRSVDDLKKYERLEYDAKREKYGALNDGLITKISSMRDSESVRVFIALRIQPYSPALEKSKYSAEALRARSIEDLKRVPLIDKESFITKYQITKANLKSPDMQSEYESSPDILIADVNKT